MCFGCLFVCIDSIEFLSSEKLVGYLMDESDGYYHSFSPSDLSVREVANVSQYKEIIKQSPINFRNSEKLRIRKILRKNNLTRTVPWKIGLIGDDNYEGGLPHTRQDVIILPRRVLCVYSDEELLRLLLHERVHVFQRTYPFITYQYIRIMGYKREYMIRDVEYDIRANPDIDRHVYSKHGKLVMCTYNKKPRTILDVTYNATGTLKNSQKNEHPYEAMAIDMSELLS